MSGQLPLWLVATEAVMVLQGFCQREYDGHVGTATEPWSLLLLVMSNLVLCQNVSSSRICHDDSRCLLKLHNLYHDASYNSMTMHFHAKDLLREFEKQYSKNSIFFMAAIKICHTADIVPPSDKFLSSREKGATLMKEKVLLKLVMRYLLSWRDPLLHLGQEAHRLPEFQDFLSFKVKIISYKQRQLQELIRERAQEFDGEIPDKVDYSLWLDEQSLKSSDEELRLFTVYNTLRCLVTDAEKINSFISLLKCQTDNDGPCIP
ncbi:prolactin-like [Erethizon dorsatum]